MTFQNLQRKILHVDLDCFYAAVEEKYCDELIGLPVGIGGPPKSRSVLCTANYEARKFGVKAAMPSSMALSLCPKLILLAPNFSLYKMESQKVFKILKEYSDFIEPLSLDEAYLDVTESSTRFGSASQTAIEIQNRIKKELSLSISIGVAPNKFLAKVASDWRKPFGIFVIPPNKVSQFVPKLHVGKISGIGKVTTLKLQQLGILTCGDLQVAPMEKIESVFGSRSSEILAMSHGLDERPLVEAGAPRTLSVEETFAQDIQSVVLFKQKIAELYDDWKSRMIKEELLASIKGILVKIKSFDFQSHTHEKQFQGIPTCVDFEEIFDTLWKKYPSPLRLIGLGTRLQESKEPPMTLPFQMPLPFEPLFFRNLDISRIA